MTAQTREYSLAHQREMLDFARSAAREALQRRRLQTYLADSYDPYLREHRGCFVSLYTQAHQLRGCIGSFVAQQPLLDTLIDMAGAAATRDVRFRNNPVTVRELDLGVVIEVSVLTPMQPMDDPMSLRIGEDGIYIIGQRNGQRISGTFLPQVAPQQKWTVEQTLDKCCEQKMGLAPGVWRTDKSLQFFRYQATVFGESAPGKM